MPFKDFAHYRKNGYRSIVFRQRGSDVLNIGVILAHFQSAGNVPVEIERLKSFVRLGAIVAAVDFNITAETPSSPVDFEESSEQSMSAICSSVQRRSEVHCSGLS